MIENPRTGEQVEFVRDDGHVLEMLVTWTRPGRRAARHLHPSMEERWEVLEGRAAFEIDGVTVQAEAGSVVVAPAGRPHLAWNPTDAPVRLRIEMCPPLRWAELTRRLFAGDDPALLLAEYTDEVALAPERR